MEFFKNIEDNEESSLLQTIRIPKNLLFLTDKLPQANYEKIPNKRNLSFNNNKNELPDINGKNIHKSKKSIKKSERRENTKDKKDSDNKENRDRNIISENNNNEEGENKKYEKNDNEVDEDNPKKKKIVASLDHSHVSGNNSNNNHNIKIIKNTESLEVNSSIQREKSPILNEEKKKLKDNMMLPNIKNQASLEYIRYEDSRSARNK